MNGSLARRRGSGWGGGSRAAPSRRAEDRFVISNRGVPGDGATRHVDAPIGPGGASMDSRGSGVRRDGGRVLLEPGPLLIPELLDIQRLELTCPPRVEPVLSRGGARDRERGDERGDDEKETLHVKGTSRVGENGRVAQNQRVMISILMIRPLFFKPRTARPQGP